MSAGHTEGPWLFGHLGTEAFWIGPSHDQMPVAHVDHDTEFARNNSRANAALISAAPDLLAALQGMIDYLPAEIPTGGLRAATRFARAAIAKAVQS